MVRGNSIELVFVAGTLVCTNIYISHGLKFGTKMDFVNGQIKQIESILKHQLKGVLIQIKYILQNTKLTKYKGPIN